jgi:hypothetical protein
MIEPERGMSNSRTLSSVKPKLFMMMELNVVKPLSMHQRSAWCEYSTVRPTR